MKIIPNEDIVLRGYFASCPDGVSPPYLTLIKDIEVDCDVEKLDKDHSRLSKLPHFGSRVKNSTFR